ncbi:MFS transporter [Acetobacter malorum]|uniref:Major facilitator superfamily (MFS) profile domain-containing protein n=1 Tax=Acetobacter malorum TaxID=178901 RepID=A0A149UP67_9PROT|nr:MFS transporter [Acetobacter malorum]KXV69712.1 hypothetical protein AD951_05415 [Acetobacter malorum]
MTSSPYLVCSPPRVSLPEKSVTKLYRKVGIRILLLLSFTYLMDSLDRLNIGYAKHQISERIYLSVQDYGFIAGIFFAGYILFEIPAILWMRQQGARKTFARITFLWGLTSSCMCFVHNVFEFSILRFFLGVFEAGFAPACLFYLATWYPRKRMAKVVSLEQIMGPLAGIMSGPISGFILDKMDMVSGVDGWRWMFFLEGLPSIALAIAIFITLPEGPRDARWLCPEEKDYLIQNASNSHSLSHDGFNDVILDTRIWLLGIVFLCIISGIYTVGFWVPHIIRETGISTNLSVGILSAIPYIVTVPLMLFWSGNADRCGERVKHVFYPLALSAVLFLIFGSINHMQTAVSIVFMALATATLYAAYGVFLAIPSDILKGKGAATGYAVINMIGLLGGFLSPYLISTMENWTGSIHYGLFLIGIIMLAGATLLLIYKKRLRSEFLPT